MSLGLAEACRALGRQFDPAAAFDIDQQALDVYSSTFGLPTLQPVDLSQSLEADLHKAITSKERELVSAAGNVDVVVAGPPCQGHSTLNNRTRHSDPKNQLYFLVARYVKLLAPKCVIIENVPTVKSDRSGVVGRTADALQDLGYWVSHGVVDLWSIGVPQTRRRHVLIARETSGGCLASIDEMVSPFRTRPRPLSWAVEDLLDVTPSTPIDVVKTPDPVTQSRIDYLFDNDLYDLPNHMRPDCHKKDHTYPSVYGRMSWTEPAPTITSGYETMGRGRFVHPRRRRTLTAHEAARIQFIPDFVDFSSVADRTTLSRLIGNAVPPKLSYVIGLELLR